METPLTNRRQHLTNWAIVIFSSLITIIALEFGVRTWFAVRGRDIRTYRPSYLYDFRHKYIYDTTATILDKFPDLAHLHQFAHNERLNFIEHPFMPFAFRPFIARTVHIYKPDIGKTLTYYWVLNSLGFRSPERPFKKPPMTKRVLTLGGSTTMDGPTNDQTWPALLESKLTDYCLGKGYKVEVINMAAIASFSPQSLVTLAFLGVEFEPDLVISYDGVNDFEFEGRVGVTPDYRSTMSSFDASYEPLQLRLPPWCFKSYLVSVMTYIYESRFGKGVDLWSQVLAKTYKLPRASDPLAGIDYFERNLKEMRGISSEYNARFATSTAHWITPTKAQAGQNAQLREFFKRERIDYLDLDTLLPHNDWSIHVDPVHWSVKGLNLVSDEWAKKIVAEDLLGLGHKKAD